jgi:hypothetical protein
MGCWGLSEFVGTFMRLFLDWLLFSRASLVFYVGIAVLIAALAAVGTNTPAIYWAACVIPFAIALNWRVRIAPRKRIQHYRP